MAGPVWMPWPSIPLSLIKVLQGAVLGQTEHLHQVHEKVTWLSTSSLLGDMVLSIMCVQPHRATSEGALQAGNILLTFVVSVFKATAILFSHCLVLIPVTCSRMRRKFPCSLFLQTISIQTRIAWKFNRPHQ